MDVRKLYERGLNLRRGGEERVRPLAPIQNRRRASYVAVTYTPMMTAGYCTRIGFSSVGVLKFKNDRCGGCTYQAWVRASLSSGHANDRLPRPDGT